MGIRIAGLLGCSFVLFCFGIALCMWSQFGHGGGLLDGDVLPGSILIAAGGLGMLVGCVLLAVVARRGRHQTGTHVQQTK